MPFTSLQFISARRQTCWRSSQRRCVLAQIRSENRDTRYRFNFFPFHGSSFILLSSPRLQQLESCTDVSQRTFKNVGRRKKDVHQNILPCPPAWKTRPRVAVSIRPGASTAHESRRGAGEDLWSWLIFHGNVLLCLWVKYQSHQCWTKWWWTKLRRPTGCVSCEHTSKLLRCWGRVVLSE